MTDVHNKAVLDLEVRSIAGGQIRVTCNHSKLTGDFAGAIPANGLQSRSHQEFREND